MTDIADWYKQLPRFTKYWLSLTIGISLLAKIGILPDYYLVLFWDFVWRKLQVYLVTFIYGIEPRIELH